MHDPDLAPDDPLLARLRGLPKVVLHDHLDGSLRPATLMALAEGRGLHAPAVDLAGVERWFQSRAHAGSLLAYLEGFDYTVAAMASPEGLARVAAEAAEDAQADGAVLAEFRIAPLLFEPHGIAPDAAVEAMVDGLQRGGLPGGLIVCAMRQLPVEETLRAVELAIRWHGRGVVAFDLAGPEAGFPPALHEEALARARAAGLPLTLHAGEADAAERVADAVEAGARRIGHGVRLVDALDDPLRSPLVDIVRAADAHLEICPTSNVHTGAAASVATHPIAALWKAGVSLSFHTDNRLMSCITHSGEAVRLVRELGFTEGDLMRMGIEAARHAFVDDASREAAVAAIEAWGAANGVSATLR